MNIGSSRADSIEVMIGLPHLAEGELMRRARDLGQPVLVSANALSRWSRRRGVREWAGWSTGCLTRDLGLASLSLDSAGFSAMVAYGGYPWTVADYVALAAAYPFQWWASLDYCVEPEVAADREEVLDRISRTVRANIDCRLRGEDAGIGARFLPVIQGRRPVDYERCADALSLLIDRSGLVGVGSMCRRPVHGPEGLVAVIDHLDRLMFADGVSSHHNPLFMRYKINRRLRRFETIEALGTVAKRYCTLQLSRAQPPKAARLVAGASGMTLLSGRN